MRVGATVRCTHCRHTKKPRGRSAPMGAYYCDTSCPGYDQNPQVGDLWPRETEEDFGYPVRDAGTTMHGEKDATDAKTEEV